MFALGEESHNKIQCVATFSDAEDFWNHFGLDQSSSLLIDSFPVIFDSTIFPQFVLELDTNYFHGYHTWHITNNKKKIDYSFECKPFKITSEIPSTVGKENVIIKCQSIQSTDKVTLIISGGYTDDSESIFDITPDEGYFTISKEILDKIKGSNLSMRFNLSSVKKIDPDDLLTAGGIIEATRVTKDYNFRLAR